MPTHKYRIYDRATSQPVGPEITHVLDTVTLASVATTSGSAEVTCTSTTGIYPFMSFAGPNIPQGAFVQAVKNATTLVLGMVMQRPATWVASKAYVVGDRIFDFARDMVFRCVIAHTSSASTVKAGGFQTDFESGKWVPVETPFIVPAMAEASGSSLTAHCLGFNPVAIPEFIYDGSTHNFEFSPAYKAGTLSYNGNTVISAPPMIGGFVPVPGSGMQTTATPTLVVNDLRIAVPDSVAGVPPRPRRIVISHYHLIHTSGAVTKIPAGADIQILRTGQAE